MAPSLLEVSDLRGGYGKTEILHGVSFSVERGEFACVIGANGCGKTTVLKHMLGLMKPTSGAVSVYGKDIFSMHEAERARHFAYIPQAHTPPFPFTVGDVVLMGRAPYLNRLAVVKPEDRAIAWHALGQMQIRHLSDAAYTELSGGQQQLVLIARALAQRPDLLVMDEPTASLDFGNQHLVLSRIKALVLQGMGVVMVTHDPDHALFCASKVVVMGDGKVLHVGTPRESITEEMLYDIYNVRVRMADFEVEPGRVERVCIPL